jgi:hypothetical protein
MPFRISALPLAPFQPLFALSTEALAARNILRVTADSTAGFPCRVSLRDAAPGETLLLLNYEHQPAATPYRASHAIYVREAATEARPAPNEVPALFRSRILSVRAFTEAGLMIGADVTEGAALERLIDTLFADPRAAYLHIHNAKPGCYAARVDRA